MAYGSGGGFVGCKKTTNTTRSVLPLTSELRVTTVVTHIPCLDHDPSCVAAVATEPQNFEDGWFCGMPEAAEAVVINLSTLLTNH